MRCQVVFDNEHSLCMWKRHPSTVWRQRTDWREQVTTWRDLRGLLYSHSDIVCLLIRSKCIGLQLSINILIWAAWLFDHSVWVRFKPLVTLDGLLRLLTFRRNKSPPSSEWKWRHHEDGDDTPLRNVGDHLQDNSALKPRETQPTFWTDDDKHFSS
jgi:hypothetical protein